jgi:hypothetical protein
MQLLLTCLEGGQVGGNFCYVTAVRATATNQLRQSVLDRLCCHVDTFLPANEACMGSARGMEQEQQQQHEPTAAKGDGQAVQTYRKYWEAR